MCGIVGFWDKSGGQESATGQVVLTMLEALACRGPDSAGVALIGPPPEPGSRTSGRSGSRRPTTDVLERLTPLGELVSASPSGRAPRPPGTRCGSAFGPRRGHGRSTWNEHSVPAGAAWKSSAWDSGSTWSSRSARPPSSKRPTASRPGAARWRSATRGCRPRAGST